MKFRIIITMMVLVAVISGCNVHPAKQTKLFTLDDVKKTLGQAGLKFTEKPLPPELKHDPDLFLNNKMPDTQLNLGWVYIYSSEKEATKAYQDFDERFVKGREGIVHGITRNAVSANNVLVVFTVYPPFADASKVAKAIENMKSK
jgi:hypothetical protein